MIESKVIVIGGGHAGAEAVAQVQSWRHHCSYNAKKKKLLAKCHATRLLEVWGRGIWSAR